PHRQEDVQALQYSRVLVVEDDVVNQKIAMRLLEKLHCQVDVAANGCEALDAVAHMAYDCIFMDCQMPELDGFEVTKALRQREAQTGAHVPIIALTANAMRGDSERCLEAGMDEYISKPVRSETLRAMLLKWVQPPAVSRPQAESTL
ncbi:MAG: response regulator, partial [Candidatus Tectomicrobia bacterium]